jgi:hypothetical protein
VWSYTSTFLIRLYGVVFLLSSGYVFPEWYLVKHKENFTVYLLKNRKENGATLINSSWSVSANKKNQVLRHALRKGRNDCQSVHEAKRVSASD